MHLPAPDEPRTHDHGAAPAPADAPPGQDAVRPSARWLSALHDTSARLRALAAPLSADDLTRPSCASGWTVAQVLSHLGSAAEICADLVRRGLAGDERGPRREELTPVWERWDALDPAGQRRSWLDADAAHLDLLDSVTAAREADLSIPYFAGPMELSTYLGYRLSVQALHGWDAEAAFDRAAAVAHPGLVWERLDLVVSRFHAAEARAALAPRRIALRHGGAEDHLDVGAELHLVAGPVAKPATTVTGTTDALLRLVYGRSRPADAVEVTGAGSRADLVALFPGF
ncbi:maleylpyruvate isomerase N-terminal domain-containing protein [Streptomyces sp. NPDC047002]|uniref:maleylpyruvate isomerase N-terminal domain-containing protein n=1 Tax=Streptomyces sp. NPDC047002 TaxID=3155475 RepID=UPI0034514047